MAAYDFIKLNGTIVADTSQTKSEIQAEFREVFGDDIDLSDEAPEGVLVNSETIARNGVSVNNANLANQINPSEAGGIFLDAIWALTRGLTGGRDFAASSTFSQPVDLTGVPGTVIPQGSIAISTSNDEFQSLSEITLDGSGNGSVNFSAVESGPIAVGIGDLNAVASGSPLGWETVSNPVEATLGRDDESDEASRLRRNDTLALQGISISVAITSNLNDIEGVRSISYRENFTDTDMVIDGVFLLKNSIYTCVDGGSDSDIAQTLLENKTAGANWNGSELVNTIDESGQSYPVKFDRPDEIQVWIKVTIAPTNVSNPFSVVEVSVLRYANGGIDGERGFVVGADVSPFEIAGAVNRDTPEIFVKKVETSLDGIVYSVDEITIEIFEVARTIAGQITTVIA